MRQPIPKEDADYIREHLPTLAIELGLRKPPERCGYCGGYFGTIDPCVCC